LPAKQSGLLLVSALSVGPAFGDTDLEIDLGNLLQPVAYPIISAAVPVGSLQSRTQIAYHFLKAQCSNVDEFADLKEV
jgi:hypothetical protein